MGEARRKKMQTNASTMHLDMIMAKVDLSRVAVAINKLATAASSNMGGDCLVHALLCQAILSKFDVPSRVVIGFAAWRVGDGDGDVVLHAPTDGMVHQHRAIPYHAWLECGEPEDKNRIIMDFTTYQLPQKAASLDQLDGGHTSVDWCPDYLAVEASKVSSLQHVTKYHKGLFFYQQNRSVERLILRDAKPLDKDDIQTLLFLYQNPSLNVIGPNHLQTAQSQPI